MRIKTLALISIFMSGIVLLTMWPTFPLFQGYLNFGDVLVMGMGLVIGWPYALLAGVGAALADILLGYAHYAIFTLVIKGLEAAMIAWMSLRRHSLPIWAYALAGTWMAIGYGLTDALIARNIPIFMISFGYNILQGLIAASLAFSVQPLLLRLKRNFN